MAYASNERAPEEEPRCVVCGSIMRTHYGAMAEGFEIIGCETCGARRTWPAPPESEIGAYYPPSYYGENDKRFVGVLAAATRMLRKKRAADIARNEPKGPVLDVGCGGGLTLAELKKQGYEPFGIELSEMSAKHARDNLGIDVRTNLYDAGLAKGTFRIVMFWHSLEHLREPDRALARAYELLAPGGLLVVAVPNSASIEARVFRSRWFHLDVPRHYHHFTTASVKRLVENAGFGVEEIGQQNLEQNPYGVLQSAFNVLGFEENLLYSMLKVPSARAHTLRDRPLAVLTTAMMLPSLGAASLALSLVQTALGEGGTLELRARRAP